MADSMVTSLRQGSDSSARRNKTRINEQNELSALFPRVGCCALDIVMIRNSGHGCTAYLKLSCPFCELTAANCLE